MHIVLWDTRKRDVTKDMAGGFGIAKYHGRGGVRGRIIRHFYKRDYRPTALNFAYLAAIFKKLGHRVTYSLDEVPAGADLYVFNPSLITLDLEKQAIRQALAQPHRPRVLVTGLVGYAVPEVFSELDVTVVRGECENLLWKLDEALAAGPGSIDVGSVRDLNALPFPDWSLFEPQRFRIAYDFTEFPTAFIQQSRGCTFTCNYCPYIVVENSTRFRDPLSVFEEMRHGIREYGFRSFKFRDPLFGLDRRRALQVAELIGRLPRKIQFSVESRIDLMRPDTLKALKDVGLTSITIGIETPDEGTLKRYKRAPIKDDRQREFVALCRSWGIRTVAGFMIGFPEDTKESIRNVIRYAKLVNPTFANFNIVTPYPGTEFAHLIREQVAHYEYTQYNDYTPVLKYQHLTPEQVLDWHFKCYSRFYFRWEYVRDNGFLAFPWLKYLGFGPPPLGENKLAEQLPAAPPKPAAAPASAGGLPIVSNGDRLRHDGPHHVTSGEPRTSSVREPG